MASLFLFGVTKITSPAPGLGPSWQTGINIANTAGMHFGRDIIFTFGPLGFLDTAQSLSRPQIMLSMAFSLTATALLWRDSKNRASHHCRCNRDSSGGCRIGNRDNDAEHADLDVRIDHDSVVHER